MKLRNAIKQSCDTYFYEVARLLGVDRLSITAKKYGLGNELLKGFYFEEKKGIVPNTKWKKKYFGKRMGFGRNSYNRNRTGIYILYTFTIMFNDSSLGKWWF